MAGVGTWRVTVAQISGRALLGALSYAKTLGGVDGPSALITRLPSNGRRVFVKPLRAAAWYPYAAYTGILEGIDLWPDREHTDAMADFGDWALRRDAATTLKILSVFSSIEGLVKRGFSSWGGFFWNRHCDNGEVFLSDSGTRTASMGLRGFPGISPLHCRMICGYLKAMGQAVGASSIRMTKTRCVHRGDSYCEYRGEWD